MSLLRPCIEWYGSKDSSGYGVRSVEGVKHKTHRLAWKTAYGSIPEGYVVCHHCDNPPCMNIEHLFLGTQLDNARDKASKGRQPRGETCGGSKLTDEKAVFSIARLLSGESQASVCRDMGVSRSIMSALWVGKTWGHLFVDGGYP